MSDSLLHRIATGDQAALEAFLDRFGALVWSFARRFSRDRTDAEDAAQDALLAIWRVAGRYDPARSSEETFVAMIARRKLIDRMRSARGGSRSPTTLAVPDLPDMGVPASALIERSEDVARAGQVLADLRPEEQRVIRMSVLQGMTHAEISARLGMPIGTVKTNIRRGLARVRDVIMGRAPMALARRQPE